MNRREFIAFLASVIAAAGMPRVALADDGDDGAHVVADDGVVSVSKSVAMEMGESFFNGIMPDTGVSIVDPVPYFDTDGKAVGFIVHALRRGQSYGYVVFDSREPFGIAEFSCGADAAQSPWECISSATAFSLDAESGSKLYQLDQLTYGSFDANTGEGVNNYGQAEKAGTYGISPGMSTCSSTPTEWENSNVMLDAAVVYRNYNVSAANSVSGYSTFAESVVEEATHHYACSVSAMLTVCSYYVQTGGLSGLKEDHLYLWDKSGTSTYKTSGGVQYGETAGSKIAGAVASYCAKKDKTVKGSQTPLDNWSRYRSCTDSGNVSIFDAELAGNSSSAHSMAVLGYMSVVNKSDALDYMNTLMVFDGWHSGIRILNHNTGHYSWHSGVFFAG